MDQKRELEALFDEFTTLPSASAQVNLIRRVQEILLHRDPSRDAHELVHFALPFLRTLFSHQSAQVVAALLSFLTQLSKLQKSFVKELFDLINTVLSISFSSEKNVIAALQNCTSAVAPAFEAVAIEANVVGWSATDKMALWKAMSDNIELCVELVGAGPVVFGAGAHDQRSNNNNNRSVLVWLTGWKYLERVVLLLSEAQDSSVYRDPMRSNTRPDQVTIDLLAPSNAAVPRDQLLALGVFAVQRMCECLFTRDANQLGQREMCVAINSLSLLSCLRPQHMKMIVPSLLAFHSSHSATSLDRTVQETLKANLVKILGHPLAQAHADEVTECLISLRASERAFRAISKSKLPRGKYVSAPSEASLRRARFGKRGADSMSGSSSSTRQNADRSKRSRTAEVAPALQEKPELKQPDTITHDSLVNLPANDVVNLVLQGFSMEMPKPTPPNLMLLLPPSELKARMTSLLAVLATPSSVLAIESSAKRKRDPRRRREMALESKEEPALVQIFDDAGVDEMADWISTNASTIEEPLISVSEDNSVQVFLKPVNPEWCREMAMSAVTRILQNEYGAGVVGEQNLRENLVCRLASSPWLLFEDRSKTLGGIVSASKSSSNTNRLPSLYQTILDFVLEQYSSRWSLALTLLHHEYIKVFCQPRYPILSAAAPTTSLSSDAWYNTCLEYFLRGLVKKLDLSSAADKRMFSLIISRIPRVTVDVLRAVSSLFDLSDGAGVVLGITTLRDLVRERKSCGEAALNVLLRFTSDKDVSCRNSCIRCVANQLYAIDTLKDPIEKFAIHLVNSLEHDDKESAKADKGTEQDDELASSTNTTTTTEISDKTDIDSSTKAVESESSALQDIEAGHDDEGDVEMQMAEFSVSTLLRKAEAEDKKQCQQLTEFSINYQKECALQTKIDTDEEVLRRLELFLALCAKKPELLHHLVSVYSKTIEIAHQVIFYAVEKLIKHLIKANVNVVEQLHGFDHDSLSYVCHVLQILCHRGRPSDEFVQQVLALYESHKQVPDAISVLIPLLPGMKSEELFPMLPDLLSLPLTRLSVAITKLLEVLPPQLIPPKDLLLQLHHLDLKSDANMQKKVIKAINLCVEHRHVFPVDVLLHVCKALVEENPPPKLSLRTVILTVTAFPSCQKDVAGLLSQLAARHIWEMEEAIWKGFIKCSALIQPLSFPILLQQLPIDQLRVVLEEEKELLALIREYLTTSKELPVADLSSAVREFLDLK